MACAVLLAAGVGLAIRPPGAAAAGYVTINGAGSTWSQNAIDTWRRNVAQFGMNVNYTGLGSSDGRNQFRVGTVDWAASDIAYGVKDGNNEDPPPTAQHPFVYVPVTAGGTTFMYNLKIGTRQVTNLRLSGATITKIFTGVIKMWNDPAIAADNPQLRLPGIKIVPVVRSDGSGATAQLTQWMVATQGSLWNDYCAAAHRTPCTQTSVYPIVPGRGMVAQLGDANVAGYVKQKDAVGTIGYVQYSYAKNAGFPVAKMLNKAGYYTEPTAGHVAVSLLKARINNNANDPNVYLTQDLSQVYVNPDKRTYPLSGYSYMIMPTSTNAPITKAKGLTLADFGKYALCQGQAQVNSLGYSALPINLVEAGFAQLKKIPGANIGNISVQSCHNPTFTTNGTNLLVTQDPNPPACDKQGPTQCTTGTGGSKDQDTPATNGSNGTKAPGNGSGTPGGGKTPGSNDPNNPDSTKAATQDGGNGATGQQTACDADSGDCAAAGSGGGGAGQSDVFADPVSAEAGLGDGFRVALMVLAGALLVALTLGPPLIALGGMRRRRRSDRFTNPGGHA
ncbi:phosphate ABC transporter substrate-binding protein PstS [Actinoplanes sp. TBRC 11911]|nr:phosphate ABC transporter substrate-binding protein PstS [Actinoplanes sp. TBRC 11911]